METESTGVVVASVEPFTALSNEGTMVVEVFNTGAIETTYIVTVTDYGYS